MLEFLQSVQVVICCGRDSNDSGIDIQEILNAAGFEISVVDGGPHPEALLRRDRCGSGCDHCELMVFCCVLQTTQRGSALGLQLCVESTGPVVEHWQVGAAGFR